MHSFTGMRPLILLGFLGMLTACSSELTALREADPKAVDFAGALAAEYRALADSEYEQGRGSGARHFARKGLRSLHGVNITPDMPDESLSPPERNGLASARAQLLQLLNDGVKTAAPQELARVQLLFDCWHYQVLSHLPPEQALCAAEFNPALSQLIEVAGPEVYGKPLRHFVTFAPHKTSLAAQEQQVIDDVVCTLAGLGSEDFWVELSAYVGRGPEQRKRTERRISAVRKALIKSGVPEGRIRIRREGARAVMLSRDNLPMNTKRVTITIAADAKEEGREAP